MKHLRKPATLLFALVLTLTVLGADGDARRFDQLGHRLVCNCGCNQILLECNHVGCQVSDRMRGQLSQQMDAGKSDADVLQFFVGEYGAIVLAAPEKKGFGLVAWITPFIALFGALMVVTVIVRNWKLRPATVTPAATAGPQEALDPYREKAREETDV